ncbi:aspartyl-tRNA synthetase [Gloeophyllum trabeum ATCC 11539]|uniref:aspartate--tRNA ligase n=1 Tax=Gloeophyllum trabeum (strain ATCC 11539 / FP-39264 / Madison 617) TaxID=670483 RepID=S7Q3U4_GLOTA|nr:aspartyl-tRNA synthetase [Gloeophyllum trabeum ATCC 11539]EPQ54212.1 aspartyl-tRNA synthetase [Gloeophyllum trabeum ATCC 11539]
MSAVKHLLSKLSLDKSSNAPREHTHADHPSLHEPSREEIEKEEQRAERARIDEEQAKEREANKREAYEARKEEEPVCFRARVHHVRAISPKIMFLIFRQQIHTIQGVLAVQEGAISENMVRWAEGLSRETIVLAHGKLQKPREGQEEVSTTTVHNFEVRVEKLFVIAEPSVPLPFQVEIASRPKTTEDQEDYHQVRVGERTRLDNRVIDLRTPTRQAIFRIHAGLTRLFREFLDSRRFIEIHTSKFEESGVESGASLFRVDYFGRPAFLAQSPQVGKQMCIAADLERVYEVGPVFRAENSNTHRHLTEFTGLDVEMAIERDYTEVMDLLDQMILHILRGLQERYRDEIETVKLQFPHEDFVFLDKTPRLKFAEGIQLLKEAGWKEEDGSDPSEYEDLSTKAEQRLGQLVKEKYHTDYYILDKFPLSARPFYTMPDPNNDNFSNSFDFFLRGEEILSGGQRIHHALMLEQRMRSAGLDPDSMKEYVDGFRWGCPPHGGGGIGLERVIMLFLKLGNIRWASLFPRDPKSFSRSGNDSVETTAALAQQALLQGPESSTVAKRQGKDMPPLENLIAKYGDGTNTSWTDPSWTVWRDEKTGAAVGYMTKSGFAIAFGNPLCETKQIPQVAQAYLGYLRQENLKPIWCCVDAETESYLTDSLGWSSVIAVANQKLNPAQADLEDDKNVRRKMHRMEREGLQVAEIQGEVDKETRDELEKKLEEWRASRSGRQFHLTGVRPFDDMNHRLYYIARDKEGRICALVVLAEIAAARGFQVKWALEFPGAPSGSIEYTLSYVIKKMGEAGVQSATFGPGASQHLHSADNVSGVTMKILEKSYNGIASRFNLTNKSLFRTKFGVEEEPLYVCYPKGGIGLKGVKAILDYE